jgi:hypothetical protein
MKTSQEQKKTLVSSQDMMFFQSWQEEKHSRDFPDGDSMVTVTVDFSLGREAHNCVSSRLDMGFRGKVSGCCRLTVYEN